MEERHVTTGDGPSEAAQRLMDGIGVFSEIEDYGRRIEVLAEAMSVGIRISDYELLAAGGAETSFFERVFSNAQTHHRRRSSAP